MLRDINIRRLKRNGRIVFLDTPLSRLTPTDDRPLSDSLEKLQSLYRQRKHLYEAAADVRIVPPVGIENAVKAVKEAIQ